MKNSIVIITIECTNQNGKLMKMYIGSIGQHYETVDHDT